MKLKIDLLFYMLDVHTIILFGSILDRNNPKDIDLLIVSDEFEDMFFLKRKQHIRQLLKSEKIDPICVTVSEYLKMKNNGSVFSQQILSTGRIIYEKHN